MGMISKLLLAGSIFMLASGAVAHADPVGTTETFSLTLDGCTGGCGTGPTTFGTVVLTQTSTGVTVVETLNSGSEFVESAGESLGFNVTGATTASITDLTTGFVVASGKNEPPYHEPPFGDFALAVTCGGVSCGPGSSTENAGPLSFEVLGVNVSDFFGTTSSYGDVFFTSDIIGPSGNTGDVGAGGTTPTSPTPEPSSLVLLGTGVLGAAGMLRRRFSGRL
jgi:hypothetical protein